MGITHKSFTLIELVIAVGIIGLILPAVFSIFFVIIRQQLVLVSYQEMKYQGDSAQRNIKDILQNKVADITDSTYTATDICPLPLTPTPTYSPDLYMRDRDGNFIHLYLVSIPAPAGFFTIASDSANMAKVVTESYNLTSKDVTVSNLAGSFGFFCYRINEFTPAIVTTKFTVQKSKVYSNSDISLPYLFNARLRNY